MEYIEIESNCTDSMPSGAEGVWCGCTGNYTLTGMWKFPNGSDLTYIDQYRCGRPLNTFINEDDCYSLNMISAFDDAATAL